MTQRNAKEPIVENLFLLEAVQVLVYIISK